MARSKREFRKLSKLEKSLFDEDSLTNPYSDIRILNGDRKTKIQRILVGIDIEVGEILLAERLSQKGKIIDLVLAHHPTFTNEEVRQVIRVEVLKAPK